MQLFKFVFLFSFPPYSSCFLALSPPSLAPFPDRVLPPPASPEHLHGWVPARALFLTSVTGKCRFACEDVTLAKPQAEEV